MTKSGLPKSVRKFIREQKAHIRKTMPGRDEQARAIEELYRKFLSPSPKGNPKSKR